jgi:hypothetical protein
MRSFEQPLVIGSKGACLDDPWQKLIIVMPAYSAEKTLRRTFEELPHEYVDEMIVQRTMLETLPLDDNSDDFVFDNEMIAQAAFIGFHLGEISCPTKSFEEAS